MRKAATKGIVFSYEEINALTSQMSDLDISARTGFAYSAVRKARLHYGLQTFTQRTGLVKIAKTGELRIKGSVRGAVRSDGLRDDYFALINTPAKAYWLGALMSDGWVSYRNGRPKETGLAVQYRDREWLYDFQDEIGHTGRIVTKTNKRSLKAGGKSKMAVLRITCQRFTEYAVDAGVLRNKSGKLAVPQISPEFHSHFCRGMFDGDGSIGSINFTLICNNESFADQMRLLIASSTGHELWKASLPSPVTGKPVFRLTGYKKDRPVLHWMHQSDGPVMQRKYEKFQSHWN